MKPTTITRIQTLSTLIPALAVAVSLSILSPASADRGLGYKEGQISIKNYETTIRVTGELMCTLAAENSGQACDLKIKENGTDRVFGIADNTVAANALKRLYLNGARTVTVVGTLANNGSIAVASSEAN